MPHRTKLIYVYLTIFGLVLALFYYFFQPFVEYQNSPLADSNKYEKIYEYFRGGSVDYHIKFPFNSRVLIPFLAAQLCSDNINFNFFIVNSIFAVLSILFIYKIMDFYQIDGKIILLSVLWISLHWAGPFRQNAFNPVNVDLPMYCLEVMFLLLFLHKKYVFLLGLSLISISIKEVFLALSIIFCAIALLDRFVTRNNSYSIYWMLVIVIAGIIFKVGLDALFPSNNDSHALFTIFYALQDFINHPLNILRWLLAFFTVFAAFSFSFRISDLRIQQRRIDHISILFIVSIFMMLLSFLGGRDYTRLIMLVYPFIMTFIVLISKVQFREYLFLFLISLPLSRFWMVRTDSVSGMDKFKNWLPEYADTQHLVLWLAVFVVYFALVLFGRTYVRSLWTPK